MAVGTRDRPSPRLLVIGAGPIGVEAALHASRRGYDVRLLEADSPGAHLMAWGHIRMFSPWAMNCSALGLQILEAEGRWPFRDAGACPTGRELATRYVLPLTRTSLLRGRVIGGCRVIGIGRDRLLKGDLIGRPERAHRPFRVLARRGERDVVFEAEVVIDASGVFGQPRRLGNGGLPAPGEPEAADRIDYLPVDFETRGRTFAGRRVLLIGDGHTAATAALSLRSLVERDPRTRVLWALRAAAPPYFERFLDDPLPERDRLMAEASDLARGAVRGVEVIPDAFVESIADAPARAASSAVGRFGGRGHPLRIALRTAGGRSTMVVDRVLAHVGFQPDRSIYSELQVHECYASGGPMKLAAALLGAAGGDCLAQPAPSADLLSNPEPGFFILGSKSYGRNSSFLLRQGLQQIDSILGSPDPSENAA
jgi:hypothetical protein